MNVKNREETLRKFCPCFRGCNFLSVTDREKPYVNSVFVLEAVTLSQFSLMQSFPKKCTLLEPVRQRSPSEIRVRADLFGPTVLSGVFLALQVTKGQMSPTRTICINIRCIFKQLHFVYTHVTLFFGKPLSYECSYLY